MLVVTERGQRLGLESDHVIRRHLVRGAVGGGQHGRAVGQDCRSRFQDPGEAHAAKPLDMFRTSHDGRFAIMLPQVLQQTLLATAGTGLVEPFLGHGDSSSDTISDSCRCTHLAPREGTPRITERCIRPVSVRSSASDRTGTRVSLVCHGLERDGATMQQRGLHRSKTVQK